MILTLIPALLGRGVPQGTAQGTRSPADMTAGVPGPSSTDGAGATSGPGFAALFLALLGGGAAAQAAPEGTESASLAGGSDQGEGAGAGGSADAPSSSALGTSARVGSTAPAGWAFLGGNATVGPEEPDGGMDPRLALTLRTTTPSTGTPSMRIVSTETPATDTAEVEGTPRLGDGPAAGARADAPRPVRSDPGATVSPAAGVQATGSPATGARGADAPNTDREVEAPGTVRRSTAEADTDDETRLRESAGPEGTSGVTAAAVSAAHAPSDVRKADRALSKLDPELRAKVERVIERMADEHGTRVELVEGYRSSERQRFLYAQGRTRPGPVVTWTKTSLHMDGKAADLKVEGPWSQREAYVLLQKVAAEERLGTLGMKDPGHVELADATVRTAAAGEAVDADLPEAAVRPVMDRRLAARVARPASVAQVARVARPARVAVPGSATSTVGRTASAPTPTSAGSSAPTPTPVDVPVPTPPASALESGAPGPDASFTAPVTSEAAPRIAEAEPRVRGKRRSDTARPSEMATGQERPTARPVSTAFPPVRDVGAADPMAQVDRILEVREAMASVNNARRVTVRLDGTAGPVEKVHVELVDQALRGSVDVNDPALAARLRGEVGEVLRTLEEKGYDPQSLAVKLTNASSETAREGLGGALRSESTIQALRTVLGTQAGTPGRDAHDRSQSGGRQGQDSQNAFEQQSRRENRRDRR